MSFSAAFSKIRTDAIHLVDERRCAALYISSRPDARRFRIAAARRQRPQKHTATRAVKARAWKRFELPP